MFKNNLSEFMTFKLNRSLEGLPLLQEHTTNIKVYKYYIYICNYAFKHAYGFIMDKHTNTSKANAKACSYV